MDKDKIAKLLYTQLGECIKYKQPRLDEIKKNYAAYYNKVGLAPEGYKNLPIPVMSGYVQTLLAKIDDPVRVSFEPIKTADYLGAKRVSSLWEVDKKKANYDQIDRWVKKNAIFSGIGAYKVWSDNIDEYQHHLEPINFEDLLFQPRGGGDLNLHSYKGQYNLKKSKSDLEKGAEDGVYDKGQINELVSKVPDQDGRIVNNDSFEDFDEERQVIRGLDPMPAGAEGDLIYNFCEGVTRYKGKDYYAVIESSTGTWIRLDELKKVFKSEKSPFVAWLIDEDAKDFVCKSLADDIRPLHEMIRIAINDMYNNVAKRNYGQRAFDPTMFKNAVLLKFRRDGLIPVDTQNGNKQIASGIHEFVTPNTTKETLEIVNYLDNFFGTKTGITPDTQGNSEEDKVGIYYGNLQQAADRLGLINKSYKKAHEQLAERYICGIRDTMTNKISVRIIGKSDVEYITKNDANPDYDIIIESSSNAERLKEIGEKRKSETLSAIVSNPALLAELNPRKTVEELLTGGEYDEQDIKEFMDKDFYGNKETLSKADSAVQMIKENKDPEVYKQANQIFCQRFAEGIEDGDLKEEQMTVALQYFQLHWQFAMQNAVRNASVEATNMQLEMIKQQAMIPPEGQPQQPQGQPQGQPNTRQMNMPKQPIGQKEGQELSQETPLNNV